MKIREKDFNNYDKISMEFNKLFRIYKSYKKEQDRKNNLEDEQINGDKNNNNNIKNNEDDLSIIKEKKEIIFNLDEIIEILNIPTEKRTMKDIHLLRKYLKKTKIGRLFQNEMKPKGELYNKLLTFLCFQMKFKKVPKDEILFTIGSRTDFFYLIMSGKIEVLKPLSKIHTISGYEYFLHLMNYRKKNEKYLFSLCLTENLKNFEIRPKDAELIPYIYLTYKLNEIRNNFVDFEVVFDIISVNPEDLGLDPEKILSNGYMYNKIKMIKMRMPIITQHELNMYKFLDDKVKKKEVRLFQYEPFLKIGKNEYFGEASFSGKGVRNGTVKIIEECYFGYLDIQLYNTNFYQEKKEIFDKKVHFLYNNFFFGKISFRRFTTKFFNWFISEEYDNNIYLYKENTPCEFIYFIEDGIVELESSRTVLDIQILLNDLEEKREAMKERGLKFNYNNISSEWNELETKVVKRQTNKILILGKNNIFGLESFYYRIPYITNARIISPKAKIVKIDKEHLYQILIRSNECLLELEEKVHNEIKILTKRFFSLNNVQLLLIDNKIAFDEKLKYEKFMNDKKKENESKLRVYSPFPDKKIEIRKIHFKPGIRNLKRSSIATLIKYGSTSSLINDKRKNYDIDKDNKDNKTIDKNKYFFDIFGVEEHKNKNNRNLINSASADKKESHCYINDIEENLLQKVKKDIKILKNNKYFLTKINTDKNTNKENVKNNNLNLNDFHNRKYIENNRINRNLSVNDLNNNISEKSEFSVFVTKFDEESKKNKKRKKPYNKNVSYTVDNYRELTTTLPSVIRRNQNKKNASTSIPTRNEGNVENKSIEKEKKKKSLKDLNINFRYYNHLIKNYSLVNNNNNNNNNKNDLRTQQQDSKLFDPKEKYKIFNPIKKNANLIKRINKIKGLNEFGFPLQISKVFKPKIIKVNNDLKLKMKNYQEYRRKLQRKFEEIC